MKQISARVSKTTTDILPDKNIDRTNETTILRPTIEAYEALECAFDFFNYHLFVRQFGVELPHVMLTMPKHKRFQGYFQKNSWNKAKDQHIRASEIALNPQFFNSQIEVCQTLVHEMVHLAQAEFPKIFGQPSSRGYHNEAFAESMITVGLMPSSTGKPGGRKTGPCMSDYVIEGGPFAHSYEQFVEAGYAIRWASIPICGNGQEQTAVNDGQTSTGYTSTEERERDQKRRSKTKYHCSVCGLNAWAKPKAKLACVTCATVMREDSPNLSDCTTS